MPVLNTYMYTELLNALVSVKHTCYLGLHLTVNLNTTSIYSQLSLKSDENGLKTTHNKDSTSIALLDKLTTCSCENAVDH